MRYKITITEETQEVKLQGKEWKEGGKIGAGEGDQYGYTPEIEKTVDVTREIYAQNVDTLDLKAVIKAINEI